MEKTITIAGKKFPKPVIYGAAAAAAGIVGYAWWTRGSAGSMAGDEALMEEEPLEDTGFLPMGGTQSGVIDPFADDQYKSDQEWFNDAKDKLVFDFGVSDVATAAQALDRYLKSIPMTQTQSQMVAYVLNTIGPPPSGPKAIRLETSTPPAAVGLGAPSGLKGTGSPSSITWSWNAVTGATGYDVELIQGTNTVIRRSSTSGTNWVASGLASDKPYRIAVWAKNSANQRGDRATTTARTTKASTGTPAPGGSTALKVTGLKAEGSNRTDITWIWNRTPGAAYYNVYLIQGENSVMWSGRINATRFRAQTVTGPLRPGHPYRIKVVPVNAQGKGGTSATHVARTK